MKKNIATKILSLFLTLVLVLCGAPLAPVYAAGEIPFEESAPGIGAPDIGAPDIADPEVAAPDIPPGTDESELTGGLITAFTELPEAVRWQNTESPVFPETVEAGVEGNTVQIPVTWEADHDYDAEYPQQGLYVFTAVLGEGYSLAPGVEVPLITVYIPQAQRMMMRMAGAGGQSDPLVITTAAQLAEIATLVNLGRLESFLLNDSTKTAYLQLGNDLDLSNYGRNWNDGKGWLPIGSTAKPFQSHFDGNGKSISGLYINDSNLDNAGLFGFVKEGSVKNLELIGMSITGKQDIGGIAGSVTEGIVENCYVNGTVSGNANLGGVVGYVEADSKVQYCYAGGEVDGGEFVGGIAGQVVDNSAVENCYSTNWITGTYRVGGVVGQLSSSTVKYCYATGAVYGYSNYYGVGGVAGNLSGTVTVQNCAALNFSVTVTNRPSKIGCVVGSIESGTAALSGNVAFSGMLVNGNKVDSTDYNSINGASKTSEEIKGDDFFQVLFANNSAWTYENGKLPGFGAAVELPEHLIDSYFQGEGTSGSPFLIGSPDQLALLAQLVNSADETTRNQYNGKHYKLIADIDLTGYGISNESFNYGSGWIPIGSYSTPFAGDFNGNRKRITGLSFNGGSDRVGLFGRLTGKVYDLHVIGVQITAGSSVGSIAGDITGGGLVERCSASGTVIGRSRVGGIAGHVGVAGQGTGTIKNCYSACNVNGDNTVGGIAGDISYGTLENCYSIGAVYGNGDDVGGVGGYCFGTVKNCVALNNQIINSTGSDKTGRIVGEVNVPNGLLSGNFAFDGMTVKMGGSDKVIDGTNTASGIDGLSQSAAELQSMAGFPYTLAEGDIFGQSPWTYEPGSLPGLFGEAVEMPEYIKTVVTGYFPVGDGSESNPYQISTAAQLAKLAELLNNPDDAIGNPYNGKHYKLTADIDLSGYGQNYNDGKGWIPIGNLSTPYNSFDGHFNGDHHKITGLYINNSDLSYAGLFGYIYNGSVRNLGIEAMHISGRTFVGGLAGVIRGDVQNCYAIGSVTGNEYVGGLAGSFANSQMNPHTMDSCYTSGTISGTRYVGGLIGSLSGTGLAGILSNSYATTAVNGYYLVGGIVGVANSNSVVQYCYASGAVVSDAGNVGGLIGVTFSDSTIKNCVGLNPSVEDQEDPHFTGRVSSFTGEGNCASNYAFSGMQVNGTLVTDGRADNYNGADLVATQAFDSSFWTTAENWDTMPWDDKIWKFENGKLPILLGTNLSGQSGDGGVYLIQRDIGGAKVEITGDLTYTGSKVEPTIKVTFDGTTLVEDKDYTFEIISKDGEGTSSGINAGKVELEFTGQGNFTGAKKAEFVIEPKLLTDSMVTVTGGPFTYTGTAHELNITVEDGSTTLELNTDYEVTYTDNINAGTAKVSISGKGNYGGNIDREFTIQPKQLEESMVTLQSDSLTFTGAALKPTVIVTDGSLTLTEDVDYEIECFNNIDAGEAELSVIGIGNYNGEINRAFTIQPKPVTITPDSGQSKKYYEDDPWLSFTNDGGLPIWYIEGYLSREEGEDVGQYAINLGTLDAGDNYTLLLASGIVYFTIEQATVQYINTTVDDMTLTAYEARNAQNVQEVLNLANLPSSVDVETDSYFETMLPITWRTDTLYNPKGAVYEIIGTLTGNDNISPGSETMVVMLTISPVIVDKPVFSDAAVLESNANAVTAAELGEDILPTSGTLTVEAESIAYTIDWNGGQTLDRTEVGYEQIFTGTISYQALPDWLTLPIDLTVSRKVTVEAKTQVTISGITTADKTYDGEVFTPTGAVTVTGGEVSVAELIWLYESTDDGSYSSATAPTDAGSYRLTISVPAGNSLYKGSQSYPFTIAKRPVTVKAEDKSMTRGGTMPEFTYSVEGQLAGETALVGTPVLSSPTADINIAGSYPITVDLTGVSYTANYTAALPAYTDGTLTVSNPPSVGGGGGQTDIQAGSAINQALNSGQTTATVNAPSDGKVSFSAADLTRQNENSLTLNVEYPGLQIGFNPGSLPQPAEGGTLQVSAAPVTDPGVLNTLYVMAADGRGIGVGYSITVNQIQDGESSPVTQLNGEITLAFELSPEDLAGIDPASLIVCKVDDSGNMIELGGQYQNGRLTVSTSHLCKFFITGKVAKERIQGADRYLTAAAVSQKGWEKADNVILACGQDYADALTGAVLAGMLDAPVLLTGKDGLSEAALKEIERLQAKNIYLIGGTGAVSAQTEAQLKEAYNVLRLQGTDRYATAAAVGEKIKEQKSKSQKSLDTVILATAQNYPDALAIAPFAAREGIPILFTAGESLNPVTKQALSEWGIQKIIIAGGTGAVAASVEDELKNSMQIQVKRLAGSDRYLTALAIAKDFGPQGDYKRVVMATGESFADALAGASFAAKNHYPVLLSGKKQTAKEVLDYIGDLKIDLVYILGGEGAISDKAAKGIY